MVSDVVHFVIGMKHVVVMVRVRVSANVCVILIIMVTIVHTLVSTNVCMVNVTSLGIVRVVPDGLVIIVIYHVHLEPIMNHVVVKVIVYTQANVNVRGTVRGIDVNVHVPPTTVLDMAHVRMVHVTVLMVILVNHVHAIV